MRRLQRAITLASTMALVFALAYAAPVAAAAPSNDDLGNATVITSFGFFDRVSDAAEGTLQDGETGRCDRSDIDSSAWYEVTLPFGRLTVAIGDVMGTVNAAIYGPFGSVPADIAGLGDPFGCVNGTGGDAAWGELVDPGTYVIQLTTIVAEDATPSIWVDFMYGPQVDVRSARLVAKGAAVDVTFDVVCWSYYDRDELYTDYAYASVVQAIGAKLVARGRDAFYGPVTCDGSVQTFLRRVTTDSVPFKKGTALVEGYLYLEGWGVARDSVAIKIR